MFSDRGPTLRELAVQALSSVEHGYDLLAPKFDRTPYRTPDRVLDAVTTALRPLGPFGAGLDLCCGTGAGLGVLRRVCRERVVGVDFSAGMLAVAGSAVPAAPGGPAVDRVRADVRRLPFTGAFDLAVSFGALGHFLPEERPALFAHVHAALRPGGVFAFPLPAPPPVGSRPYWALWGFDAAMRVRNALWRPRFVMYYRTLGLADARGELTAAGFAVGTVPLEELGRRPDGSPRCRLVVARRGRPPEGPRERDNPVRGV
ncbi:methyltransferase domain-containing protein [Streptomyces sp. WAC 00631]|uniref:class I SAM-dependent methyltransferase n=1 Tax=unclassified Streptomyces TaxID=2593676 RepID=UPI000F7B27AC|nr:MULTISPECIES: class I SAM-dependent methyltransferase [unclassified Streptomyces]MCC5033549.1 methyltransferase domain-containing protein [Streptomyces sp. WAC 00631]MCC9743052.1 methyltransferase domain-containing protein [Streptomyces sp. MNU89]